MPTAAPSRRPTDLLIALAVTLLALSVYLLTSTTTMQLTSDEGVNLALAENVAKFNRYDVEQMATLTREVPNEHGLDGQHYSKYGLTQAWLSWPFYKLALARPELGAIGVILQFNTVISALCVGLLYLTARQLGFTPLLSVALATPVWVYSKRYMSEPLSSLALLGAFYCSVLAVRRAPGWALAAGLFFAPGVLNKAANTAFAPLFGLYLLLAGAPLANWRQTLRHNRPWLRAVLFAMPVLLALSVFAWYNMWRFGNPLHTGYGANEGFIVPLWEGLAGLLLSPGKSAFLYLPLLLLLLPFAPRLLRRLPAEGTLMLALLLGHVLLYATWWIWWGGWNWGVRFLIPAWAFAVLALGDGLAQWRQLPSWLRLLTPLLLVASLVVQVLGVLVDHSVYLAQLLPLSADPDRLTLTDPARQPIINQLRLLQPPYLDFGWLIGGRELDGLALSALLAGVALAVFSLWLALRARRAAAVLAALLTGGWLLFAGHLYLERAYACEDGSARQIVAHLQAKASPDAGIVYLAPRLTALWQNANKTLLPAWGTHEEQTLKPATLARLQWLSERHSQLWVITETPPGAPENGIERWLAANSFRLSEQWYGPFRLVGFRSTGAEAGWHAGNWQLGEQIALVEWLVADEQAALRPGESLQLALRWRALGKPAADYKVFVHLLDGQERIVAQQDVAPGGGYAPTGGWQAGQEVVDRYALPLAAELPTGSYRLVLGMYNGSDGKRLAVVADGKPAGDRVELPLQLKLQR